MSYDLMVFRKSAAPNNEPDFLDWYNRQTEWPEDHFYDDPAITSEELRNWFLEMIETFPPMNGPLASDNVDDLNITEYCIGRDIIYAAFAWSKAEQAYKKMIELAGKHKVGFYDVSGTGDILIPIGNGKLKSIKSKKKAQNPWWKFW